MQVLKFGYRIPLVSPPSLSPVPIPFQAYSPGSDKFLALAAEVEALVLKEAIEQIEGDFPPGFYNRLFVVPKSSGGWRPVLDVSALNLHVQKTKFHMETTRSVLESIRQGDWMVSLDMQDAYFHIPIHRESRKYLRFMFEGKVFQFRALCFGLATAPQVFTRVLSPIGSWLHILGVRISLYLDDWLLRSESESRCMKDLGTTLDLARKLGILVNKQKSQLVPSQSILYLGMILNAQVFRAFLSPKRVQGCLETVQEFLDKKVSSANQWMRLLGKLTSVEKFVTLGRLHMRPLQFFLRASWCRKTQPDSITFPVTDQIKEDLRWWLSRARLEEGLDLRPILPNLQFFSDASDTGWGALLGNQRTSGAWSEKEKKFHINVKELLAIFLGLRQFRSLVEGRVVAVHSDNSTALSYVRKQGGTQSFSLYEVAKDLLLWSNEAKVQLVPRFVPGKMNVLADELSRQQQVLPLEWTLDNKICQKLWRLWGRPSIDLFATSRNNRLPLFCSPVPDPLAWSVDAMLLDWSGLEAYAFPPFGLIREVLNKFMSHSNVTLTLIAPFWPRKEWFPDLLQLLVDFPRLLPPEKWLLKQPHFKRFHQNLSALALTGFRLSGILSERKDFQEELQKLSLVVGESLLTNSIKGSGESSESGVEVLKSLLLRPL
ncbi:MAG: reverse transcriptase domain-containing protein [Propionibacteriaceae bacterium]